MPNFSENIVIRVWRSNKGLSYYRDISQGNFSMNNHILKLYAGEEPPLIMNQTRTSESLGSASESRVMKYPKTM